MGMLRIHITHLGPLPSEQPRHNTYNQHLYDLTDLFETPWTNILLVMAAATPLPSTVLPVIDLDLFRENPTSVAARSECLKVSYFFLRRWHSPYHTQGCGRSYHVRRLIARTNYKLTEYTD